MVEKKNKTGSEKKKSAKLVKKSSKKSTAKNIKSKGDNWNKGSISKSKNVIRIVNAPTFGNAGGGGGGGGGSGGSSSSAPAHPAIPMYIGNGVLDEHYVTVPQRSAPRTIHHAPNNNNNPSVVSSEPSYLSSNANSRNEENYDVTSRITDSTFQSATPPSIFSEIPSSVPSRTFRNPEVKNEPKTPLPRPSSHPPSIRSGSTMAQTVQPSVSDSVEAWTVPPRVPDLVSIASDPSAPVLRDHGVPEAKENEPGPMFTGGLHLGKEFKDVLEPARRKVKSERESNRKKIKEELAEKARENMRNSYRGLPVVNHPFSAPDPVVTQLREAAAQIQPQGEANARAAVEEATATDPIITQFRHAASQIQPRGEVAARRALSGSSVASGNSRRSAKSQERRNAATTLTTDEIRLRERLQRRLNERPRLTETRARRLVSSLGDNSSVTFNAGSNPPSIVSNGGSLRSRDIGRRTPRRFSSNSSITNGSMKTSNTLATKNRPVAQRAASQSAKRQQTREKRLLPHPAITRVKNDNVLKRFTAKNPTERINTRRKLDPAAVGDAVPVLLDLI